MQLIDLLDISHQEDYKQDHSDAKSQTNAVDEDNIFCTEFITDNKQSIATQKVEVKHFI